jgi:hypothetical protein
LLALGSSLVVAHQSCLSRAEFLFVYHKHVSFEQVFTRNWIIPPFSPSESGRNSPVEYGSYSPDMIGGSLNRHPIKIPIPA